MGAERVLLYEKTCCGWTHLTDGLPSFFPALRKKPPTVHDKSVYGKGGFRVRCQPSPEDKGSSTLLIIPDAHKLDSMEVCWYWLDDSRKWVEYGTQHPNYSAATITSAQVEQAFQADQEGTLRFQVHSQKYEINFKDMVQRNLHTQNTRRICRWPNRDSSEDGSHRERTEERWYWLDESNHWNEYGDESLGPNAATITSAVVEKAFQDDPIGTLRFEAGLQQYEINFKDMVQRNVHTQKTRKIYRGPTNAHGAVGNQQGESTGQRWYWLDNSNKWVEYGDKFTSPHAATLTSTDVEKAFQSDPEGTLHFRAGLQRYEINFKDMVQRNVHTQKTRKICRWPTNAHDTVGNQQGESTGQRWYWLDNSNKWVEYGDKFTGPHAATITSAEVEKAFQSDPEGTLRFRAGLQRYEINFKDMVQRNLHTQVARQICRRPNNASGEEEIQQQERFSWNQLDEHNHWVEFGKPHQDKQAAPIPSAQVERLFQTHQEGTSEFEADSQKFELDFKEMVLRNLNTHTGIKICRSPNAAMGGSSEQDNKRQSDAVCTSRQFPSDWDLSALPKIGYELVKVDCSTSKYREITSLFKQTMKDYKIHALQRIQNPTLWQHFQLQKEHMKKRSPGQEVDERFLFHGTSKSRLTAICEQNFDWRICGVHGTTYGKGSYFARDARYAHQYCSSSSGNLRMFVARVLVGDFVRGNSEYLRPPPRPDNPNRLYDSCVDDPNNPSIFVIFEKLQIYPAYILEYIRSSK